MSGESIRSETATPQPFDSRMLDVGGGHLIHVEQVGQPDGIPVLFLHGGPGSGAQAHHRALFDAGRFRAILFDQRGSGRSRPSLRIEANTTSHLIADIEFIRSALSIERWLVMGGSWGSTLGLAYAERFPQRVAGLVLRAIFLGTRREVEWAFIDGPRKFRPDLFAEFMEFLKPEEREEPLQAYWRRILDPDPSIHLPAAQIWYAAERTLSEIGPKSAFLKDNMPAGRRLPPTSVIEAHYLSHDCFLEPGEILAGAHLLAEIPGRLVQSRYDLLCPPEAAFALAAAWPGSRLQFIECAGHSATEPGVTEALVAALGELAGQLGLAGA